jgi:sulfite dehydrogenase (quinone) subunit SoeA
VTDLNEFSLNAITQRPMAMYHSWDSQNAWLRQIHSHNYLYVNTKTALEHGINDGAWMWIESQWGKVKCMARHSEAVDPGTVWTWNAIGKAESAWSLDPASDESKKGFLLNHLITEELSLGGFSVSNSDPITGQAGWYDVRVKLAAAGENEPEETWPQVKAHRVPGMMKNKS